MVVVKIVFLSKSPVPEIPVMVVMGGLMLAILLGALEQTIVAVALPVIAGEFNGFALMAWLVSAYLVASTVVTPIYGKLSDLYGRRAMLTTASSYSPDETFNAASAGLLRTSTLWVGVR